MCQPSEKSHLARAAPRFDAASPTTLTDTTGACKHGPIG